MTVYKIAYNQPILGPLERLAKLVDVINLMRTEASRGSRKPKPLFRQLSWPLREAAQD